MNTNTKNAAIAVIVTTILAALLGMSWYGIATNQVGWLVPVTLLFTAATIHTISTSWRDALIADRRLTIENFESAGWEASKDRQSVHLKLKAENDAAVDALWKKIQEGRGKHDR